MINTKLQSIIDTKSAIGNAIVNKGGTITSETPFFNYAAEIDNISSGGGAYSTWVAQDENSAKYQVYNGYDFITNPTPSTTNLAFNQWLLNNSASGDIVLTNAIMRAKTYNGSLTTVNEADMPLLLKTATFSSVYSVISNDGFIYASTGNTVQKFNETTFIKVGNTISYGATIFSIKANNGFLYVGGNNITGTNRGVSKFNETTLEFVGNTVNYGVIESIAINNGFIYVGGIGAIPTIRKYNETTLEFVGNTASYSGNIFSITTNNGFIYAGGNPSTGNDRGVAKYHEGNLVRVGNTVNYGGRIESIAINNGFIYVGGNLNQTVQKFDESTLEFVGNTASYGNDIYSVTTNNGFIYAGGNNITGTNRGVSKYYESNLAFVGNTVNYGGRIDSITINKNYIYVVGATDNTVQKFKENNIDNFDNQTYYTITNVKE
jgi:hypothetical protein